YRNYLAHKPDAANRREVEERIAALAPAPVKRQPAPPAPRACPEGKVMSEATDGHCCWPEQVWSKRHQACTGVPRCPARLSAEGENCVHRQSVRPVDQAPVEAP